MTRISIGLLTLALALSANGQSGARIVAKGADVQVLDSEAQVRDARTMLEAGDSVETGPASFAVLAVEPGIQLTLGADSAVRLDSLDALPSINLIRGSLGARTDQWTLRIASAAGVFLLAETPAEAGFALSSEGLVSLQVLSGSVTMDGVDASSVIFRGSGERAVRVYRSGTLTDLPDPLPYVWFPNVYVGYPGFVYETPAPNPGRAGPAPEAP